MFRKFLILLALSMPAHLFAQVDYTVTQYTNVSQTPPLSYINQTDGVPLNLWDDEVRQTQIGFDFNFYGQTFSSAWISSNGVISFQNPINGCCSGYNLSDPWFEYGIFAFQTDLINIETLNAYTKIIGEEGSRQYIIAWYDMPIFYDSSFKSTFEVTLFEGSNNILINYGDINSGGRFFTAGIKGSNADGYELIYTGTNGNYLDYTAYLFSPEMISPPPTEVNCITNPLDVSCIITSIIDSTEPVLVAEDANSTAPESELVSEEVFLAELEEQITEQPQAQSLEEMLADNSQETEQTVGEQIVASRELADDERASTLADSISTNVLEAALSVATIAETTGAAGGAGESISGSSDSKSSTNLVAAVEAATETTSSIASMELFAETSKEESSSSDLSVGADILEAGRLLGQAALNETLTATTESAVDSMSQAESVAATSFFESQVMTAQVDAIISTEVTTEEQSIESVEQTITEQQESVFDQLEAETMFAQTEQQAAESDATIAADVVIAGETIQQQVVETLTNEESQVTETLVINVETQTETIELVAEVIESDQSAVSFESVESAMEVFAANLPQQITTAAEQDELENMILQQSIASSQSQQEETNIFSEAEAITIASDPALASAFNMVPNAMNLEITGVLSQKQEEKSDAELRAEQVVAANKEEQDAINSNYMDADQSGIVAAIGSDTDFSTYRSAMLRDANAWYKPEDIYKGIIIRDNVRGMYFLEKGSTDTYKQMVEEQYKDE